MLASFARRQLPKTVYGLCLLCDKILLSSGGYNHNPPKVHRACLLAYQRQNGPYAGLTEFVIRSRRGAPLKKENLQLAWAWTIRTG